MSLREANDEREAAQGPLREVIGLCIDQIQYLEKEEQHLKEEEAINDGLD